MDFKTATDKLMDHGIGLSELTGVLLVGYSSIRAARMEAGSAHYRPPPQGWRLKLAALAHSRSARLLSLAEELLDAPLEG